MCVRVHASVVRVPRTRACGCVCGPRATDGCAALHRCALRLQRTGLPFATRCATALQRGALRLHTVGAHADLGLLTVAPKASRDALEIWDSNRGTSAMLQVQRVATLTTQHYVQPSVMQRDTLQRSTAHCSAARRAATQHDVLQRSTALQHGLAGFVWTAEMRTGRKQYRATRNATQCTL
jgi:hypothetical protein